MFGDLAFTFDSNDASAKAYVMREWYEESRNPIYRDIERILSPKWFIDVGGNFGLTALLAGERFPNANVVVIEPIPRMAPYIEKNLGQNGRRGKVLTAFVGDKPDDRSTFHVNPRFSQDSRVIAAPNQTWPSVTVPAMTLDFLTEEIPVSDGVFIKIDTQGYEAHVLRGGEGFLAKSSSWLIKAEFGPRWLREQGSDPEKTLSGWTEKYSVAEVSTRTRFGLDSVSHAFLRPLSKEDAAQFVTHVESLNRDDRGWVDIWIAPRTSNFAARDTKLAAAKR